MTLYYIVYWLIGKLFRNSKRTSKRNTTQHRKHNRTHIKNPKTKMNICTKLKLNFNPTKSRVCKSGYIIELRHNKLKILFATGSSTALFSEARHCFKVLAVLGRIETCLRTRTSTCERIFIPGEVLSNPTWKDQSIFFMMFEIATYKCLLEN